MIRSLAAGFCGMLCVELLSAPSRHFAVNVCCYSWMSLLLVQSQHMRCKSKVHVDNMWKMHHY